MRIIATGDTHKDIKRLVNDILLNHMTGEDYLLVLGDFSFIYAKEEDQELVAKENEVLDFISSKINYTLIFIDGNHENMQRLDKFPLEIYKGAKVHKIRDNIIHLVRGEIMTFEDGTKIWGMGGGYTIHAYSSSESLENRKYEMPTQIEYKNAIKNLERVDWKVDYVISHATSLSVCVAQFRKPLFEEQELNSFLEYIRENIVGLKHVYSGHLHINKDFLKNQSVLFDDYRDIKTNQSIFD